MEFDNLFRIGLFSSVTIGKRPSFINFGSRYHHVSSSTQSPSSSSGFGKAQYAKTRLVPQRASPQPQRLSSIHPSGGQARPTQSRAPRTAGGCARRRSPPLSG